MNDFLVDLLSKNLIDFVAVEEGEFPDFVAEVLGKVLEICCFVSLDIIEGHEQAFLLVREFVDKYFIKYVVYWRHITPLTLNILIHEELLVARVITLCVEIFVVYYVHQINYNVFQGHLIHPIYGFVFFGAGTL